ncbi:uncharacterized protein involved in response to NO [Rhodobacteraceae bacterium MBR-64]|jgi:uncharacterized protein involved in response to NO
MTTSAQKIRDWHGPEVLRVGFRPFFLLGAIWSALAMALWLGVLSGRVVLPTAFDPVGWHAHEMLFGYLGAIAAGFLLTAVPNWTGRMPVTGWPLAGLAGLWLVGRAAVTFSAVLPPVLVAVADLAFLVALAAMILREIIAGRNWRNLIVLALLGGLIVGNGLFHWQVGQGAYAAGSAGFRLGLAAAVMMIVVIGGRVVPSFTRNWLVKRGSAARPAPFGATDKAALLVSVLALGAWVIGPFHMATGALCLLAGIANLIRLARWSGLRTGGEALLWVLHAGYLFVPLGFLAVAVGVLWPGAGAVMGTGAQHVWMVGAIGVMTLAMMTRASLGHAGRPLTAGRPVIALYVILIVAVGARFGLGMLPGNTALLHLAATGWIAGFGGFAVLYWRILTGPRAD